MRIIAILLTGLLVTGCGLPRDQRGTLDRIRGQSLNAVIAGPDDGRAAEEERLRRFARELGAELEISPLEPHAAMAALEDGRIDIVAGLPKSSPFRTAGFSRAYRSDDGEKRVWAVRSGENALLIEVNRALHGGGGR